MASAGHEISSLRNPDKPNAPTTAEATASASANASGENGPPDTGFAIAEREVEAKEIGGSPRHLGDLVLGVVRDGKLLRAGEPEVDALEKTDRILYVRDASLED